MIAKLSGLLDSFGEDWVVIDVGGVGYLIYCSARTLGALPSVGEAVRVLVETHVREDHIHLYGFTGAAERDWFRLLQTVQGVGARLALGILSVLTPGELAQAVAAKDKTLLMRANGVGGRLAERIVNELKDKVANLAVGPGAVGVDPLVAARAADGDGVVQDAVSALVNLGYRPAEAYTAVAVAGRQLGAETTVEALITSGLKELAS